MSVFTRSQGDRERSRCDVMRCDAMRCVQSCMRVIEEPGNQEICRPRTMIHSISISTHSTHPISTHPPTGTTCTREPTNERTVICVCIWILLAFRPGTLGALMSVYFDCLLMSIMTSHQAIFNSSFVLFARAGINFESIAYGHTCPSSFSFSWQQQRRSWPWPPWRP